MLDLDQAEVVDAGGLSGWSRGLGDGGVDVTADHEGDGVAGGESIQVDGEPAQVLGVVAELDATAAQGGVDTVPVPQLCRARHSTAYAEFRIMPSRATAELVLGSRSGRMTLNSSA